MSSGADSGGGSGFGYLNFNRVRCANPPPRRYESIEVDDEDDDDGDNNGAADAEDEIMGLVGATYIKCLHSHPSMAILK